MPLPIYLDYAATTPLSPAVAVKICSALTDPQLIGNPSSSTHMYGWKAQEAVHEARTLTAKLFNAKPRDIVFTSGATEANNLAIQGVLKGPSMARPHVITSAIEHKAVLDTFTQIANKNVDVTFLQPSSDGTIPVASVIDAIQENTALVSLMHVNNETGIINDIDAIGEVIIHANPNILFHVDAAQSAGKLPLDIKSLPKLDMLTFSAHKFYGPKGIGGLLLNRQARKQVSPVTFGGSQENGLRPGTLPTHQIIGMGVAAKECLEKLPSAQSHVLALRQTLFSLLDKAGIAYSPNVNQDRTYPGIVNLNLKDIEPDDLMLQWNTVAVSTGSACNSQNKSGSYVLEAIRGGKDAPTSTSDVRISFGRYTTTGEIQAAVDSLVRVLATVCY